MNRQIYQKYGFIIALIIAGISLPTSIISLTREPNTTNNDYYNTYYNQTYYGNNATVITSVRAERHNMGDFTFETIAFDYSQGDKMIAVWDSNQNQFIDVFFINKENFQLFIDKLSFTKVLSEMNNTGGFLEYEIIEPNLYFTVFSNNSSSPVGLYYQVTQYHYES